MRHHPTKRVTVLAGAVVALAVIGSPAALAQTRPHRLTTPSVLRRATAVSAAAYFWSGNGTGDYVYNSTGDSVTVESPVVGQYVVMFGGLAAIAPTTSVDVTSYGGLATCAVGGWYGAGSTLEVDVDCFSMTGSPVSAEFDVIVGRPTTTATGVFDYAYADLGSGSGTLSGATYNSEGGTNSVVHLGTGQFLIRFGGAATTGYAGTVSVTPEGGFAGTCNALGWHGSTSGEAVEVDCHSVAGGLEDRDFLVTYALGNNLMGASQMTDADAFAGSFAGVYRPLDQHENTSGAKVTIVRYSTGSYEVLFAGSEGNAANGGNIELSAVNGSGNQCEVEKWSQEFTPAADVSCVSNSGAPIDSHFTIYWVVS